MSVREEKFDWKGLLRVNLFVMRCTGLWPAEDQYYGCHLYTLYANIVLIFFLIGHMTALAYALVEVYSDVQAFFKVIFIYPLEVLSAVKFYLFAKNVPETRKLFLNLENEIFHPMSNQQTEIIKSVIGQWQGANTVYLGSIAVNSVVASINPVLDGLIRGTWALPSEGAYPFDEQKNPMFAIVFCHQTIAVIASMVSASTVDCFCASILAIITAQCELLCDNLKNMKAQRFPKDFLRCMHHHKMILKLADKFEKDFSFLILGQLLGSLLCLGFVMFYLTLVEAYSGEFFFVGFLICSIFMQILLYCYFGQQVQNKSNEIAYSAFSSNWTGLPNAEKKGLLIFITNVQKPIVMSAVNLFELSLTTFSSIVRTSWSYFAVLRQVNN